MALEILVAGKTSIVLLKKSLKKHWKNNGFRMPLFFCSAETPGTRNRSILLEVRGENVFLSTPPPESPPPRHLVFLLALTALTTFAREFDFQFPKFFGTSSNSLSCSRHCRGSMLILFSHLVVRWIQVDFRFHYVQRSRSNHHSWKKV